MIHVVAMLLLVTLNMLNLLIYISMLILNQFLSVGLAVYNISAAVKIFSKYGPVHCFMIAW